jgi:hypothetical protein
MSQEKENAASPVEQPAAAPIPYDGLTEEFTDEVARLADDAPGIREAVSAALENCNAIIAPQGNAAPAPADERAAFEAIAHWKDMTPFAWFQQGWKVARAVPAQAAEPVGWIGEGNYYTRNEEIAKRYGCLTPVYAAPQPPAQADAREGLTEQVITEAVKKWFPDRAYQAPFFARALLQGANHAE